MILSRPFATLVLVLTSALAAQASLITHERRERTPHGWMRVAKHDAGARLPLRIGLAQSNIESIEEYLMDVSHPDSPNYGQHWSSQKVAETFAPAQDSIDAVYEWLAENDIASDRLRRPMGDHWVEVNLTVEEAERLLDTEYHVYEHENGGKHVACDSYRVPKHIQKHVELITPTVHFDTHVHRRSGIQRRDQLAKEVGRPGGSVVSPHSGGTLSADSIITDLKNCSEQINPACLRALYDFVYVPVATDKNSFAIVEYSPESYFQSDLDMFNEKFSPYLVGKAPINTSIDGGYQQTVDVSFDFQGEPDLDLQYAMNLVYPQQVTLYQVGDQVEGASFNNLLDALDGSYCTYEGGDDPTQDGVYPDPLPGGFKGEEACGTVKPANVISTSYAYNEADLTPFYRQRQCNEYAKLGLQGVTVLYSSGDDGVAGAGANGTKVCLNPDGSESVNATSFNPSFPGTCPYITSVGATQVDPGNSVLEPEGACEQVIFSGGGFSNQFQRPSYQASAVASYLQNHNPGYGADRYNQTNVRALPDISANGANYLVAIDGTFQLVYGTSCASPVAGSIFTMINDARLAVGKKPIGFINPTIYSSRFQGAFNDITHGGNQGCGTPGFTAVEGWDPVTGLGTPNFLKLLALWLEMP